MKRNYFLSLMTLLFVALGGVNVSAQTYDFEAWAKKGTVGITYGGTYSNGTGYPHGDVNYWESTKASSGEASNDVDVSRFATRSKGQTSDYGWYFYSEGDKNGLQCKSGYPALVISKLLSGDEVVFSYEGNIYFYAITSGKALVNTQILNQNDELSTKASDSEKANGMVTVKVTADCDLIVEGDKNTSPLLKKITINRKDKGEYEITTDPQNDFSNTFRFTQAGQLRGKEFRNVTDVFGINMELGNIDNDNYVEIGNDLAVTIYADDGTKYMHHDGGYTGTKVYRQGTFYIFKPTISGKLTIDGFYEGGENNELVFAEFGKDGEHIKYSGDGGNGTDRNLKSSYFNYSVDLIADHTYCLHATYNDVYRLKSFTYESNFHFPKKSVVIDEAAKTKGIVSQDGTKYYASKDITDDGKAQLIKGDNTTYSCKFIGTIKGENVTKEHEGIATIDENGDVSWDNTIEGGAIVVTATHQDGENETTTQYVITIPYETYEWVFDETESKNELYANTADNQSDWKLAWKVYSYRDVINDKKIYHTLSHPVFSNAMKVSGDNARFIDATAGLLFEASPKHFGTNINEVYPFYYRNVEIGEGNEKRTVTMWGEGEEGAQVKEMAGEELSDFLSSIFGSYKLEDNVLDTKHEEEVKKDQDEDIWRVATNKETDEPLKCSSVTMHIGSKLTIPNLLPGQHIRIRWNRHVGKTGELVRAFNVTDLDGKSMHKKLFNIGSGSNNSRVGHQEFIVEDSEKTGKRVNVTFELVANGDCEVATDENEAGVKTINITGQSGWANINSIKVGPANEFLETHMNTVFVNDESAYDCDAEIITKPEIVVENTNIDERDESENILDAYKRDAIYNYMRKAGKGKIKTKLDLYPEHTDVVNGSQIETYKIVEGSYTGTLNESNCYIGDKLTERFNPIPNDKNTFRNMEFQYLNVLFGEQEDFSEYLANAGFTDDPNGHGWSIKNKQDWQKDGETPFVEFYQTEFELSQEIELPAGDYCIAVNAFYRNGGKGDGTNDDKAWIFAGNKTQNIVALTDAGIGYVDENNNTAKYNAAKAFSNGAFNNTFDFSLARGQKIKIGFAGDLRDEDEKEQGASWCILGPVKLYKYDYSKGGNAHGSFTLALESRQINGYNSCENDFLLDSVHVKVNVYEYDYNVKPYPYTWAMEHFTKDTGNNTIEEIGKDKKEDTWNKLYNNNPEKAVAEISYWTADNNGDGYRFNFGYPENMIAWKKRTEQATEEKTVQYAMKVGEKMVSGQAIPVKNKTFVDGKEVDETVATVIFGERYADRADKGKPQKEEDTNKKNLTQYDNVPDYYKEGAVFNGAKGSSQEMQEKGYYAYTGGNDVNGQNRGGTFYTIIPKYDGKITVAVRLSDNKDFYIQENGVDLKAEKNTPKDPNNPGSNSYEYDFNVKEGQHYKIYAHGSNLGFYGFKYTYKTGGELYVPEFDGLGIRPTKYWDETDGIELKQNEGLVFGEKGYHLKVPEVQEGQTLYLAVTGEGVPTIENNNTGLTVEDVYKADKVAVYKVAGKGGDIDLNLANLTLKKMAVSVDEKTISSVGWATEAREYPLDITLAKQFLNEDLKAYKVTGTTKDETKDDNKVIMEEVQYIPMTIDDSNTLTLNKIPEEGKESTSTSENNGIVLHGKEKNGEEKTTLPLFTTDINRKMSDMDNNLLVGVVAQANVYEEIKDENKIKILDQKDGDDGPYNYMLATNGYKVQYVGDERTDANTETDEVVGKVSGLGFYLILKAGTSLEKIGGTEYTGGLPKDNSAYLKLSERWAKINDKEIKEDTGGVNSAGVHQVFFIDVDSIATDIDEVLIDDDELPTTENVANLLQNGVFYTLQGIPVKNPTKGIYIFNGKKVYVK